MPGPQRSGRMAVRTCLACRSSKTRCQLPDVTVPSSPDPLPSQRRCSRCQRMKQACIVDDGTRKPTKDGTKRYGADGLLKRNTTTPASSTTSPSPDQPSAPSATTSRPTMRGVRAAAPSDGPTTTFLPGRASAGALGASARRRRGEPDQDGAAASQPSPTSPPTVLPGSVLPPAQRSSRGLDALKPGILDLVDADMDGAFARTVGGPAVGTAPPRALQDIRRATSDRDAFKSLRSWNPFLLEQNQGAKEHDLLTATIDHILLTTSPRDHRTAAWRESLDRVLAKLSELFLSRVDSPDSVRALLLLVLYEPPDLYVEGSDDILPPGLKLADMACETAERLNLFAIFDGDEQLAAASHEELALCLALYNTRIHFLPGMPLAPGSPLRKLSLAKLDALRGLFRSDELGFHAALCVLLTQTKMSFAFQRAAESLDQLAVPSEAHKVEGLLGLFREAAQACIVNGKSDSSIAQLMFLEATAGAMELTLCARCVHLQLARGGSEASIPYEEVFRRLTQEGGGEGARFLSTVTDRSTDVAQRLLRGAGAIVLGSELRHAPIVPRCKAVFLAFRTVAQLWTVIITAWSSLPARLSEIVDAIDSALLDQDREGDEPRSPLVERTWLSVTAIVRTFTQAHNEKREELAQGEAALLRQLCEVTPCPHSGRDRDAWADPTTSAEPFLTLSWMDILGMDPALASS